MPEPGIPLRRIDDGGGFTHGIVSLPVARDGEGTPRVDGALSQAVTVGVWPRSEPTPGAERAPRRSLLFFRPTSPTSDESPSVRFDNGSEGVRASAVGLPPTPRLEVRDLETVAEAGDDEWHAYYRVPCELVIRHGEAEAGVRLAIVNETGVHPWQYAVAEPLWDGPLCAGWRIGGHIFTGDESRYPRSRLHEQGDDDGYRDHTVHASLYVVAFRDGALSMTARWVNGRIYGGTGPVRGTPAVFFRGAGLDAGRTNRAWDGTDPVIGTGPVVADLSPAADLVGAEHPGRIEAADGLVRWEPVADTRIVLRSRPTANGRFRPTDDGAVEWIEVEGSADGLVEGAARGVRWTLGLAGSAPRFARFVAPRDRYAALGEFAPFPIATGDGPWSDLSARAGEALLRNSVTGRFTSGGIFRYLDQHGIGVYELSMDANEARSLFRRAWWDGRPEFYDLAMRNAQFCADLAVDHARDIVHYHGDPGDGRIYSLIYMRFSGIVLAWLETGDPWLLDVCRAIARNYAAHHRQNWPRRGIGRDADPLTGILLLWDYTGDEDLYAFAREFAGHVARVIDDEGRWLSGSGVGPGMGVNAAIGSSWNGGHFLSGFTEWLMRADAVGDPVPDEWLAAAGRALHRVYEGIEARERGFHPASTGFVGRIHWYLACRLGDVSLIERTRRILDNIFAYEKNPVREPLFTGGWAHHQNNYVDNLLVYQGTEHDLPARVGT